MWRTHVGGGQHAIGSPFRLNGETHQVIGVMPPGFNFPSNGTGVWVPFAKERQDEERGAHSFLVAARMRPEMTFEQARADIEQVGRALRQRYEENSDEGSTAQMMSEVGTRNVRAMLTALMGAVVLVLVIACVNVANLQLGRALARRREFALRLALRPKKLLTGFAIIGLLLASVGVYGVLAYYVSQRTREIGVRAALGATKRQLASLVIRQSLVPMIAGAVVGIAGSLATGRLLQDFLYQVKPGDLQVTAAIVVLLFGVGLLASWLPARRAASIDPLVALREE